MAEVVPWWEAVGPLAAARPASPREFVGVLDQLASVASRWSDLLEDLREAAHRFGGAGAAASFDVACRRAEQAFIELEIACRYARTAVPDDEPPRSRYRRAL